MMNIRKMILRRALPLMLCAAVICAQCLCSCSNDTQAVTGEAPVTETAQTSDTEQADTGKISPVFISDETPSEYPVTVNGTRIEAPPSRVVCLSQSLTEMIYEIGAGERLIGRGSYCTYPEEAAALPDAGRPTAPDMTVLSSLSPELLITATAIPEKDRTLLSEKGINVLYIPSPRSFEELGRIYVGLAEAFYGLFSCESIGETAFAGTRAVFEQGNISFGSFIYITEGYSAAGGDTFESSVLSHFGENLAENESGYVTGTDFLAGKQPDTVLLSSIYDPAQLSESDFSQLDAVKAGNIIIIDNSYFENPSGRLIQLKRELEKQLS